MLDNKIPFTVSDNTWVVAMTGASGSIYGRKLIAAMLDSDPNLRIELILSESAFRVLHEEEGLQISSRLFDLEEFIGFSSDRVTLHNNRNIGASVASGSCLTKGMIVVPCSMSTLAAIANGLGNNLIHRAADVTLKEGRKLVLVPRETPLSAIHLENMLKLAKLGVIIAAAMPGFYHKPKSVDDLVNMMVMKILDQMGIRLDLAQRWQAVGNNRYWPTLEAFK